MDWGSLKRQLGSTSERRHHLVAAGLRLAIAAVLFGVALLARIDELGRVLTAILGLAFAGTGAWHLWRARRSPPGSTVYYLPELAPADVRLVHTRRILRALAVLVPPFSAWIAWDLWRLESGEAERVSLWAPIALAYRHLGFWPAVLLLPVLGGALGLNLRSKVREMERELARRSAAGDAPRSPGAGLDRP